MKVVVDLAYKDCMPLINKQKREARLANYAINTTDRLWKHKKGKAQGYYFYRMLFVSSLLVLAASEKEDCLERVGRLLGDGELLRSCNS